VINGIASQVPLNPPGIPTTITIEVMSDDDGTGSSISRTYSLSVSSLPAGLEFFVSSSGSDTGGDGSGNYPYQTVTKALDIVKNIGMASTATFTITISGTITADAGTSNGMVDLSGSGYPQIVLQGKGSGTDAGVIDATGKGMRVLYVAGGNKVTLKDNLTLMGGSGTTGGGVHIAGGSTFTMTGGTIQGNETSSGGGVYVYNGTFIMSGNAVIAENTASANGGGVFLRSGNNTFTMNSGSISNNTASGGGGVYVSGNSSTSFTMNGGSISNNKASNGGGVALSGGNFTMDGSAVIQNNTSLVSNGGGVFIDNGTFTMKDSAGIQDNMTVNRGGGVYVSGNGSTFNMEGGTIQGNITSSSTNTAGGGGVYVTTNSIFSKTGGTITGSNASPGPPDDLRNMTNDNSRGHAVYCLSGGKKRNTTAGPGVNLDSSTTENWE
jgi:hypothetical protein